MEPTAFDTIKVLLAQIAAESYLDGIGDLESLYKAGANGAEDSSGMTKATALMWADFSSNWTVVKHQPNTSSGFSGTLLKNASGDYTLSFRSTESKAESQGGDVNRDSASGANGEISVDGFAWGQISDMEEFYSSLIDPTHGDYDSDFATYMASSSPGAGLTVTGYSLGGHLAQAFYQLHADDIGKVYTINGAGLGDTNGVPLTDLISQFRGFLSNPSSLLSQESMNRNLLLLSAQSVLEVPVADLAMISNEDLFQVVVDAHNLYMPLEQDNSSKSIYQSPLYQLAVEVIEDGTTGSFSLGVQNFLPWSSGSTIPGNGSVVTNIFGHATSGDSEFVATSGLRVGESFGVFIEDQANSNSGNFEEFDALLFDADRDFVDNIASLTGNTHSITLIVDTLYVADVIQRLDPTVLLSDILAQFFPASSNETASLVNPDDVEANSLENIVNVLGNLYASGWNDIIQAEENEAFGNLVHRNNLHSGIEKLRELVDARQQSGATSVELLTVKSAGELAAIAASGDDEQSTGYRYALVNLLPFTITSNLADTPVDDAKYDLENFSGQYLADRSAMLERVLYSNTQDLDMSVAPTWLEGPGAYVGGDGNRYLGDGFHFEDIGSGRIIQTTVDGDPVHDSRTRIVFGVDGAAGDPGDTFVASEGSDRFYGMGGNDVLAGGGGDDHLEGGEGNDTYVFDSTFESVGTDTIRDSFRDEEGTNTLEINGYTASMLVQSAVDSDVYFLEDSRVSLRKAKLWKLKSTHSTLPNTAQSTRSSKRYPTTP